MAILSLAKQTVHMCMAHKTVSKYIGMFTPIVEIGPEMNSKGLLSKHTLDGGECLHLM